MLSMIPHTDSVPGGQSKEGTPSTNKSGLQACEIQGECSATNGRAQQNTTTIVEASDTQERKSDNSEGVCMFSSIPDRSFLEVYGPDVDMDTEFGPIEGYGRERARKEVSLSRNCHSFVPSTETNAFDAGGWTVRNCNGYQEEVLREDHVSVGTCDSALGIATSKEALQSNELQSNVGDQDGVIFVFLIISLPEESSNEVWKYMKSSLVVTQSVTEQELALPISRNSFLCHQEAIEVPAHGSKLAREISARITLKDCLHYTPTRYLFQLFLSVSEDEAISNGFQNSWDKLDVVAFVQLPSSGQLLRPIGRELSRKDALAAKEGLFLGSFTFHEKKIYHHIPNEEALRDREDSADSSFVAEPITPGSEKVVLVDRKDIVLEANGARAGRPSHKDTGQLLMTKSQVEKILEIRIRWQGLSPRQRRDNVSDSDFYTFLTLNRDETAECLGVCATWLKDAIRSQGVYVWPGRPLRRTGAMLQTLKENWESTKAALRFSDPSIGETRQYEEDILRYENEIRDVLAMRVEIVKANVSEAYFNRFMALNGRQFLNPDWIALPPCTVRRPKS